LKRINIILTRIVLENDKRDKNNNIHLFVVSRLMDKYKKDLIVEAFSMG